MDTYNVKGNKILCYICGIYIPFLFIIYSIIVYIIYNFMHNIFRTNELKFYSHYF